ncbi:hypothetical protein ALC62_08720 [Cyphomyrmex costatus]|uniref:Uncharacterized protein n=1 Tax=Cyphomyrmex costatus TaxID=456900 RepID=A0A195CI56_9HYME|nr:hypothetical protein ALC62_08720 [Cyphomyrmex costatus]
MNASTRNGRRTGGYPRYRPLSRLFETFETRTTFLPPRRNLPNRSRLFADKNLVIKIFYLNANGYFPLSRMGFSHLLANIFRKKSGSVSQQSITECTRS